MPRWSGDKTRCNGRKAPGAPHDLTQPDAVTPQGKCRACKQWASNESKRREKARARAGKEEVLRAAESGPDETERGVPVYPRTKQNESLASIWQAQTTTPCDNPFAVLVDPAQWPDADDPAPLPHVPEDWSDLPRVKRDEDGWDERTQHRVALAALCSDRGQNMYNRRLAWLALTTEAKED